MWQAWEWERRWSGEHVRLSGQLSWRKRLKKTAHKFIFSFQTTQLSESWDLIEYFSKRWLGSKAGLGRQTGILYVLQIKLGYDFYTTFFSLCLLWHMRASQVGSVVKNPPAKQETWVWSLGWEDPTWRRKWQPVPVFLPGKSHGQRSLAGYSP